MQRNSKRKYCGITRKTILIKFNRTVLLTLSPLRVRVLHYHNNKTTLPIGRVVLLARWKGLEPLTYWFVASHSIQLSYQRRLWSG